MLRGVPNQQPEQRSHPREEREQLVNLLKQAFPICQTGTFLSALDAIGDDSSPSNRK